MFIQANWYKSDAKYVYTIWYRLTNNRPVLEGANEPIFELTEILHDIVWFTGLFFSYNLCIQVSEVIVYITINI